MLSIDPATLPYRPCVGIALFNPQGDVFVGERIDTPDAWQMPQGGVDPGEKLEQAALRELAEEIGTDKADIITIAAEKLRYDFPAFLQPKLWEGNYRGQEQSWVAARFTGQDSDIDLNAHDPAEFRCWKWVPLHTTPELIVPFKREIYEKVITLFAGLKIP